MKYARVINNTAIDVRVESPEGFFTPEVVAEFVSVPDKVENGWIKTGTSWNAPEPVVPVDPVIVYPKVGPIHFQMLFTPAETVAANDLKATDKVLASFWKLIDDPRTDEVDLNLSSVQNAVEYTLTAIKATGVDVDVAARKAAILSGVLI